MFLSRIIVLTLCVTSSLFLVMPASAQGAYPDRPVKVIVALPAGGSVDMIARTLGQKLNVSLGQAFSGGQPCWRLGSDRHAGR